MDRQTGLRRGLRARGRGAVWTLFLIAWTLALVTAPYVTTHRKSDSAAFHVAADIYVLGAIVCHQRPERSFHLWGNQMPVCARCVGLYTSAPIGAVIAWLIGRRRRDDRRTLSLSPRALLAAVALPTAVTVAAEWTGFVEPAGWIRALAAVPLGGGSAWIIGAALVGDLK